jgi:hypothetical protein
MQPVLGGVRLDAHVVEGQLEGVQEILRDCYTGADGDELIALVGDLPDMEAEARRAAMDRLAETTTRAMSEYFKTELERDPVMAAYITSLAPTPE